MAFQKHREKKDPDPRTPSASVALDIPSWAHTCNTKHYSHSIVQIGGRSPDRGKVIRTEAREWTYHSSLNNTSLEKQVWP